MPPTTPKAPQYLSDLIPEYLERCPHEVAALAAAAAIFGDGREIVPVPETVPSFHIRYVLDVLKDALASGKVPPATRGHLVNASHRIGIELLAFTYRMQGVELR